MNEERKDKGKEGKRGRKDRYIIEDRKTTGKAERR